ncbi:MAG TPA: TonB family protein [Terracidiphilus sp.]|jgi:TonB family protein
MNGAQAVRFEQSPGFFHYVVFCTTPKGFMAQMPPAKLPADSTEYGLCWYGTRTAGANPSQEVDGKLVVSEHHVRFMPDDPQFAAAYADLPREQAAVKHEAGQPNATVIGKGVSFGFRFSELCPTCAAGTPPPRGMTPAAILDQEFGLLDETILHYYSGWRQIYRISSGAPSSPGQTANSVGSTGMRPAAKTKAAGMPKSTETMAANRAAAAKPRTAVPPAAAPGTSTLYGATNSAAAPSSAASVIGGPKAKPVKISSADGLLVKKVPPDYPLEAKLVRLEGTVVLRAVIDSSGEVAEVNAVSGPPLLESAAVDAVKHWQYRPYAVNGRPVDVETTIAVVFALDGTHPVNRAQSLRR